jgi:hypothetical protein
MKKFELSLKIAITLSNLRYLIYLEFPIAIVAIVVALITGIHVTAKVKQVIQGNVICGDLVFTLGIGTLNTAIVALLVAEMPLKKLPDGPVTWVALEKHVLCFHLQDTNQFARIR